MVSVVRSERTDDRRISTLVARKKEETGTQPEMIRNWSVTDSEMIQKWSGSDPKLIHYCKK
jgi:hypothetical protein